ncbi:MAG: CBS domain-containing protein [Mariprofundaceae bacterium]
MSFLEQPVKQLATKDIVSVTPETSVLDTMKLMTQKRVTSVLVCQAGVLRGIITSRDLPRIFMNGESFLDMSVINVMTHPLDTCDEDETVLNALDMMINGGYRHIPVTDASNNLFGIISETDILNSMGIYDPARLRLVEDMISSNPTSINEDASLSEVVNLFNNNHVECLIIKKDAQAVGIITERDLSGLLSSGISSDTPAKNFMSQPIFTISIKSNVQEAISAMHSYKVHHIIAVDDNGDIKGIISRDSFLLDFTRFLVRQLVKMTRQALD